MSALRFLALIMTLTVTSEAEAGRFASSSALQTYFGLMTEQVEKSASLVSFKYALSEATDTLSRECEAVRPARVLEFVEDLGSAILSSRGCDAVCVAAFTELRSFVDGYEFLECRETETSPYAYIEKTRFVSTGQRIAIDFELGFSD